MRQDDLSKLPEVLNRLYGVVADLQEMAPGRPFTPDGHLVGSIGEVVAAFAYELDLGAPSIKAHDATTLDGRSVQVKLTQGKRVALSYDCEVLLVLQLEPEGEFREVYNGPGSVVWNEIRDKADEGRQRQISLKRLSQLMKQHPRKAVDQVRAFPVLRRKAKEAVALAEAERDH